MKWNIVIYQARLGFKLYHYKTDTVQHNSSQNQHIFEVDVGSMYSHCNLAKFDRIKLSSSSIEIFHCKYIKYIELKFPESLHLPYK